MTDYAAVAASLRASAAAGRQRYDALASSAHYWMLDQITLESDGADAIEALVAENERLRRQAESREVDMAEVMVERDRYLEWADQLAYSIAPMEAIGEHSSMNCPWANAVDAAGGLHQRADRAEAKVQQLTEGIRAACDDLPEKPYDAESSLQALIEGYDDGR